ncbi:MAG: DJ-1/PfpI family protein [Iamia sp.]
MYRRTLVSPDGRGVRSSSGIAVDADTSIMAMAKSAEAIDTLLVVGGLGSRVAAYDETFLAAVAALAGRARRVTSVCTRRRRTGRPVMSSQRRTRRSRCSRTGSSSTTGTAGRRRVSLPVLT